MQTIGERLEEARKRKGISLREAAEATKIRSDFLSNIEQNQFDFDLPDIYKRGFIGNYARYLKLNADTVLTDYASQRLSNSRLGKKAGSEWFGKMEVKTSGSAEEGTAEDTAPPSLGRISTRNDESGREGSADTAADTTNETTFYFKVGLLFVGTLSLVFILFILVKSILGGTGDPGTEASNSVSSTTFDRTALPTLATNPESQQTSAAKDPITLEATGSVYLVAKQRDNQLELFRGTLGAGESKTLERSGVVDIVFTAGENFTVETKGGRIRPSVSGEAQITVE